MDPAIAVEWALAALWMTFVLCGPALLAILVVGLVIGIGTLAPRAVGSSLSAWAGEVWLPSSRPALPSRSGEASLLAAAST